MFFVRVRGTAPRLQVSKTRRLLLSHTLSKNTIKFVAHPLGFEPSLGVLETLVLPLTLGMYKLFTNTHNFNELHYCARSHNKKGLLVGSPCEFVFAFIFY